VEHGLVDEYRQRKPSYYVWKELNAPAAMDAHWDQTSEVAPSSFTVTLKPNSTSDLPFYPLHDYRLAWELSDQVGKLLASGEQQFADLSSVQTVSGKVGPQPDARTLKLHLTLLRPGGTVAAERTVDWHFNAVARQPPGQVEGVETQAH
jgi:hypothetical protein